jgi:hypothetical protein
MATQGTGCVRIFFQCILAAAILSLALIAPNQPAAMTLAALTMVPLELPFILLLLWLIPPASLWNRPIRFGLVFVLMISLVGRVADYATFTAFDRGFNSIVDWPLIEAGWLTLLASAGWSLTIVAAVSTLLAIAIVGLLIAWATGVWAALAAHRLARPWLLAGAALGLVLMIADIGFHRNQWAYDPPGDAFTARTATSDAVQWTRTLTGLKRFSQSIQTDPFAGQNNLLNRLTQNDVLFIYVESYGRSSFDNPLYAQTHIPTLIEAQRRLTQQGLEMRSGWLEAPMVGGQSWLSHSTIASGLLIDNQGLYRMLLNSHRPTLYHYAQKAGFQTIAVMPGIRLDWPEADYFGFDDILDSHALGYKGLPYNWVTMPDQFTLSAFDRLKRNQSPRKPIFAQIALISSHAPWVPIAPVIEWDAVGDGSIYSQWAKSGDPPEVVWRDANYVRDQFRQSVDYSLQVAFSYAEQQYPNSPLIIILGDHEPARFVSQVSGRDVAVHFIGTPEQIAAIDQWQWTSGLVPAPDLPVWPMAQFRDQFINAFSKIAP